VRPSLASERKELAIHRCLGVESVHRLVEKQHAGSPSSAPAMPSAAHPKGVVADLLIRPRN